MKEHKFRTFCMLLNIYGLDENSPEKEKIAEFIKTPEFVGGADLADREKKCVYKYFFEHKTYDQIAEENLVTRERIRQIVCKSIRKLNHPKRKELLYAYVYPEYKKLIDDRTRKQKELVNIEIQIAQFTHSKVIENPLHIYQKHIHDLEFSIRTENALREKGILSIGELCDMTDTELLSIRNFGKKSLREVQQVLHSQGLSLAVSKV